MPSGRDLKSREEKKEFDIDKALQKKEFAEFLSRYPDGEALLEVHDAGSLEALEGIHDKFLLKEETTKNVASFIDSTFGGELQKLGIDFKLTESDTEEINRHFEMDVKDYGGEKRLGHVNEDIEKFAKMKEEVAEAEAAVQAELAKLGGAAGLERRKLLLEQAEKAGLSGFTGGLGWFGLSRSDESERILGELKKFGIEIGDIKGQAKKISKSEQGLAELEERKEALNKAKELMLIAAGGKKTVFKAIQVGVGRRMVELFGTDIREARKVYEKLIEAGKGGIGLDYLVEARAQGINEAEIEKYVTMEVDKETDEVFGNIEIKNNAFSELEQSLKEILKKDETDAAAKKRLLEILLKKKSAIRKSKDGHIKALFLARITAKLADQMF
ncbi:MAG: hypothetical protein AAB467_03225 [Patescibacteria group bacterium]